VVAVRGPRWRAAKATTAAPPRPTERFFGRIGVVIVIGLIDFGTGGRAAAGASFISLQLRYYWCQDSSETKDRREKEAAQEGPLGAVLLVRFSFWCSLICGRYYFFLFKKRRFFSPTFWEAVRAPEPLRIAGSTRTCARSRYEPRVDDDAGGVPSAGKRSSTTKSTVSPRRPRLSLDVPFPFFPSTPPPPTAPAPRLRLRVPFPFFPSTPPPPSAPPPPGPQWHLSPPDRRRRPRGQRPPPAGRGAHGGQPGEARGRGGLRRREALFRDL